MPTLSEIIDQVYIEYGKAEKKFGAFQTYHEGYAVILEELDELWDEIKAQEHSKENMRGEAIQVATMAVRFIHDLLGED